MCMSVSGCIHECLFVGECEREEACVNVNVNVNVKCVNVGGLSNTQKAYYPKLDDQPMCAN